MTGRDLIIYILENNLENEEIFKDGRFIGFMTPKEAAYKFGVGEFTVKTWIQMGLLESIEFDDIIFIPANSKSPVIYLKGQNDE